MQRIVAFILVSVITFAANPRAAQANSFTWREAIDSTRSLDSLIRLDDTFLRKMTIMRDTMAAISRRGPVSWKNASGVWVGTRGTDTVEIPLVRSFADITPADLQSRLHQIEESGDVRRALAAAQWDPAEYAVSVHTLFQSALLYSIELGNGGRASMEKWAKQFKITIRPEVFAFLRAHGAQLEELGFARAGFAQNTTTSASPAR